MRAALARTRRGPFTAPHSADHRRLRGPRAQAVAVALHQTSVSGRNVRRKNVSRALPERRRAHYTSSMKLAEKGRYAPPPNLPKHAQAVSRALATWPDVHARTHWLLGDETKVDGADFYVGELELGHIHLQGEAHIAVPAAVRNALIKSGVAAPFRWSESFVVFEIASSADVELAQSLFRLAYDRLKGASSAELVARCATIARDRSASLLPRPN